MTCPTWSTTSKRRRPSESVSSPRHGLAPPPPVSSPPFLLSVACYYTACRDRDGAPAPPPLPAPAASPYGTRAGERGGGAGPGDGHVASKSQRRGGEPRGSCSGIRVCGLLSRPCVYSPSMRGTRTP